ncbi:MAG: chromate transporter [Clostridiales bacterium]|nr:chromate transporter [Clostridiales bacterium]
MTAEQVTDIVAIAEMTPGPLGLNCATFAGMQAAGIPGAIAANLGALTPALTLCAVAAAFFNRFRESRIMQRILVGVRPACLGMVLAVLVNLAGSTYLKQGMPHYAAMGIGLLDLVLVVKCKVSIPVVILLSAGLGLLLFGVLGIPISW